MSKAREALERTLRAPGDFAFIDQLPEATAAQIAAATQQCLDDQQHAMDRDLAEGVDRLPAALRGIVRRLLR